ncbi:MAG: hypothetical protein ACK5N9_10415, partial [Pirellula sp.]
ELRQGSNGDPCKPEIKLRTKHWTEGLDSSVLTCVEITPRPSVNASVRCTRRRGGPRGATAT